jgi:L-ribulose-5-phosphate 3-epimerase
MSITRRDFLAGTCAVPASVALTNIRGVSQAENGRTICLFSKHLPELGWKDLARTTWETGFQGIDLTVRKGGHVLPENAARDLPQAVSAIRAEGLQVPMITTDVLSATPIAREVFATAGKLGIPFLKPGYYYYKFVDVRRELEEAARQFRELAELAAQHRVQVGFHNHARYVGAPVWDVARFMDNLDPQWTGYYFDACHAVTEGGDAGWKIAMNLASPRIKMIAVKDFIWEKTPKGRWEPRICPLGEGMVPWKEYFAMLAQSGFRGPVSLHIEYEIPGATAAARQENTLAAARRDLAFLRARLQEASL